MDEVTKAVELTKAKMLELNAAAIRIICSKATTHEELETELLKLAAQMEEQRDEIRVDVAEQDPGRN